MEIAGIGPGPFAGMMLADAGAEVIRVDRIDAVAGDRDGQGDGQVDVLGRGKRSIAIDLKTTEGVELVLQLAATADILFEGFRPGVAERLGIGPRECTARQPRLVYGRVTGWGQSGPLAQAAGHDINYIALAGALHGIGYADRPPPPPLNLVADYGGGGMLLAFGLLCGVIEARRTGSGQVVDAAMLDGSALLTSLFHGLRRAGSWTDARESNLLDGGAPFYRVYECSDGKYVALGSVESRFSERLLDLLGFQSGDEIRSQWYQRHRWPALRERMAGVFRTRTREEWCSLLEGTDACFAPVLTLSEAAGHPHNQARQSFVEIQGTLQPAAAPRFQQPWTPAPSPSPGQHTGSILKELDVRGPAAMELESRGVVKTSTQERP